MHSNFYDRNNDVMAIRGPITEEVKNGLFTVLIGGGSAAPNLPLPTDMFDENFTVGITVDKNPELPRIRLTSVPYAFQAENANNKNRLSTEAVRDLSPNWREDKLSSCIGCHEQSHGFSAGPKVLN